MKKRGLSQVVTIVLLILLVLAAIVIIWVFMRAFIFGESESAAIRTILITERDSVRYVEFYGGATGKRFVNVTVRKDSDAEKISKKQTPTVSAIDVDLVSVVDNSGTMNHGCNRADQSGQYGPLVQPHCVTVPRNKPDEFQGMPTCNPLNVANVDGSECGVECKLCLAEKGNQDLAEALLDGIGDRSIALVRFGDSGEERGTSLTKDPAVLNQFLIDFVDSNGASSCLCCGLKKAAEILRTESVSKDPEKAKAIIVMADGDGKDCDGVSDVEKANQLRAEFSNFKIYAIGFTSNSYDVGDDYNEATLVAIAGGRENFFEADVNTIIDIYTKIFSKVQTDFGYRRTIDFLEIRFSNGTDAHTIREPNVPIDIFDTKTYSYDLEGKITNVNKVEIYPVVVTEKGKEITGQILDTWEKGVARFGPDGGEVK